LTAFLNTKYGVWDVKRRSRRSINQTNVNPEEVKLIDIPLLDKAIQKIIKHCFDVATQKLKMSTILYQEAEYLLLDELGLANWLPSIKNSNVKTFKKSFLATGRLDAEYYQPKYDDLEKIIKKYIGGATILGKCLSEINTGEFAGEYRRRNENLAFYIRNTNISKGGITIDDNYYVDPNDFTKFVAEGDILTARVGAIGNFGTVTKELAGSVYSDNVLSLRFTKDMIPEVYTCYFSSRPNLELLYKISGGSVQPLVTQTSIKELLVPLFTNQVQKAAYSKIMKSLELQKASYALLDCAKLAVEIAIDRNEAEALKYLKSISYK
jgi:restriction endonuclease S subunit